MFKPLQFRFRGTVGKVIPINATGGEVFDYPVPGTQDIYRYHVFPVSSVLVINNISNTFNTLEYLVVAGAGAGGAADNETEGGAGGGAGGWREGVQTLTGPTSLTIGVGAGGAGRGGSGNSVSGDSGLPSSVGSFSSAGGGGGGSGQGSTGFNGGSGGGVNQRNSTPGLGNVPATIPSQGNNGARNPGNNGGGGGGIATAASGSSGGTGRGSNIFSSLIKQAYFNAGYTRQIGIGTNAIFSTGGNGGLGTSSGGAAGAQFSGNGGQGGRAAGEQAGNPNQQMNPGGNGGSGIVIVRYRIQ